MFNYYRKELEWGGRKLILETGKIARQADGAVLARYGDTIVLCTAVGVKSARPGQDFFPLTVNYQEKAFAAGRIPGGFFKREGRPRRLHRRAVCPQSRAGPDRRGKTRPRCRRHHRGRADGGIRGARTVRGR